MMSGATTSGSHEQVGANKHTGGGHDDRLKI